jgi:hypothetical protein
MAIFKDVAPEFGRERGYIVLVAAGLLVPDDRRSGGGNVLNDDRKGIVLGRLPMCQFWQNGITAVQFPKSHCTDLSGKQGFLMLLHSGSM